MSAKAEISFKAGMSVCNPATGLDEDIGQVVFLRDGRAFFARSPNASDDSVRRAFLHSYPTKKLTELKAHLPGLVSGLPLPGTAMHKKFTQIIGPGMGDNNMIRQFEALVKYRGVFSKNGLTFSLPQNERSMRSINISKALNEANDTYYGSKREDWIPALMAMHKAISNNQEIQPGGLLADDDFYKTMIIDKSEGGQNLVIDDPLDPGKKVKIILGAQQGAKAELEVVANKVIEGAGFSTPKTELLTDQQTGRKIIRMDNYKLLNGVTEARQEYFLDLMKKPLSHVHSNTYEEMAKFLDVYEDSLPEALQDASKLDANKQRIFQWAMVNSSTNNTDNHGRNLSVMVDEKGRIDVAPFIDVMFDGQQKDMSTWVGGPPPKHHVDIMDNAELKSLWDGLNIQEDFSAGLEMRDSLAKSLANVSEYAANLGIAAHSEALDHIVRSTSIQSSDLGELVNRSVEAKRYEVERAAMRSNDMGPAA